MAEAFGWTLPASVLVNKSQHSTIWDPHWLLPRKAIDYSTQKTIGMYTLCQCQIPLNSRENPEPDPKTEACQLLQDAELCMTRWCHRIGGLPWKHPLHIELSHSQRISIPMFGAEGSAEAKPTDCCLCYVWYIYVCMYIYINIYLAGVTVAVVFFSALHLSVFFPGSIFFAYVFWVFVVNKAIDTLLQADARCNSSLKGLQVEESWVQKSSC